MPDIRIRNMRSKGIVGGWRLAVQVVEDEPMASRVVNVPAADLLRQFMSGSSMISLAKRHGIPLLAIEETIRWYANHPRERARDLGGCDE